MGQSGILFSDAARNLGVTFDSQLALKEELTNSVRLLTWISGRSVQSDGIFLLKPPKLVSLLVLSRFDYCNALLAGSPWVLLDKL